MNQEKITEYFVDHEVRIRIQEKISKDILSSLRWLIATIVAGVIMPIGLHFFKLI